MKSEKFKKLVLAYSGGLDTSIAIKWLLEHKAEEVVAVVIDVGQKEENLEAIRDKALTIGASNAYIIDASEEFIRDYAFKALQGHATYEAGYPLSTAIARPLIAKLISDVANKENADAISHGCTAKGNDQVRFELAWQALNPELAIVAPAREWGELFDREQAIEYAEKNNIPIPIKKKSPYSIDLNAWGRSAECGILEDPWAEPPADVYALTTDPVDAPDQPEYLEIEFNKGIPITLNKKKFDSHLALVEELNAIAGKHGIGRYDQIENRLVGIKSREIYEAPAAKVLLIAHQELEYLVTPRDLAHYKELIDKKYSELIYDGKWFSPLRESLEAFIQSAQERVTGIIRLKLYKGSATVVGRKSEYSMYSKALASYENDDKFDHNAAVGFINLFGLSNKTFYTLKTSQD